MVASTTSEPYSRKTAEEALLGGAMLRPEVFLEDQSELKATDFSDPLHRGIWETLERLTGEEELTSFDVLASLQSKEVDTDRFMENRVAYPGGVSGQIETVKKPLGWRAPLRVSALRWYEDEEHEGVQDLADKIQELFIGLADKVDPGKRGLSEVGPIASQALEELKRRKDRRGRRGG